MRALASYSFVLMLASAPAHAGSGLVATSPSAPGRTSGIWGFLSRHFTSRAEVKQAAALSHALRAQGDLVGSAKALTEGPKAQNLFERIRLNRQQKALFKEARANLDVDFREADPAMGKAALKELGSAGKLSFFKKWSAGVALVRSGKNSQNMARKLGNEGRFDEALSLLEYSRGERGQDDRRAMRLSDRLYRQAMESSEQAAKMFNKAVKHGEHDQMQKAYEVAIGSLGIAAQFGRIHDSVPRSRPTFQENRARMIASRMGTTLEKIDAELAQRAEAEKPDQAEHATKPDDKAAQRADHVEANGEPAINPS